MEGRFQQNAGGWDRKTTLGSIFMMGFEGTTVTPHIRSLIQEYRLGVILLNASNFVSAEQAVTLIRELQITAHNSGHEHPLLIAVDQENGIVQSLADPSWITQFPSSLGIAATRSLSNAYDVALATGRELACVGVNWLLGPAVDVVLDRSVPGFGSRSFGDDPVEVAKLGGAFVRGLRDAGVASTAKHFPLGGSLKLDESSTTVPVVFNTLDQLRQKVLIPFQEAIRENVDAIMAAGCAISSIGPKLMHACFSKKVVTDLLRQQLGYEGVAVSECLEMESIASHIGVGQAAVMGIHAGCDILTICQSLPAQLEALAALSLALENGALSWRLVRKSAERVLRLREKHTSWPRALNPPGLPELAAMRSSHRTLAARAYEQAITLMRDDHNFIPLSNVLSDDSMLLILSPLLHHRAVASEAGHLSHVAVSGSNDVSNGRRGSASAPKRRKFSSPFGPNEGLQYGEDYFQDFGRAMACYNFGDIVHTSYTSHGVRSEHEKLIEKADAIIILVADANRNQYQLGFAKHVAALVRLQAQQRRCIDRKGASSLILVSLSSAYDVPPDAPFPAHLCTYDSSTVALHCLARVLGGDLTPNKRVPGLQVSQSTAAQEGGVSNGNTVHQQTWLVERFDYTRDYVPIKQFLRDLLEADEIPGYGRYNIASTSTDDEGEEGDEGSDMDVDYADVVSALSSSIFSAHNHVQSQHFVIRNTSTGAIYGFASALSFPDLRRGCLGALLVDPEKRELSMGRDLHTSVVRYLSETEGVDIIQLGAPIMAIFPGLPLHNNLGSLSSTDFFEKLGWRLDSDRHAQRLFSLIYKQSDGRANSSQSQNAAEAGGIYLETNNTSAAWDEVLEMVQKESSLPSSSRGQPFCRLVYQQASTHPNGRTLVIARDRESGSIVGSALLLDHRDKGDERIKKNFPSLYATSQRATVAILVCPIVVRQYQQSSDYQETIAKELFAKTVFEAENLGCSAILAYAIPETMSSSLEEIGFTVDRAFVTVEKSICDAR